MNKLKIFIRNFESALGDMKAIYAENGTVWFLPQQILKTLGYSGDVNIKTLVEDDEYIILPFKGKNKNGEIITVNQYALSEAGLWRLVLDSNTEASREVKRWLTHDVMPNIQANDGYIVNMESLPEDIRADLNAELAELRYLVHQQEKELESQNTKMEKMQNDFDIFVCTQSNADKFAQIQEVINEARNGYLTDAAANFLISEIRTIFIDSI